MFSILFKIFLLFEVHPPIYPLVLGRLHIVL